MGADRIDEIVRGYGQRTDRRGTIKTLGALAVGGVLWRWRAQPASALASCGNCAQVCDKCARTCRTGTCNRASCNLCARCQDGQCSRCQEPGPGGR